MMAMNKGLSISVTPAKAGVHRAVDTDAAITIAMADTETAPSGIVPVATWAPAFAGATG